MRNRFYDDKQIEMKIINQISKQSELLTNFYKEWLRFALDKSNKTHFYSRFGLCKNHHDFIQAHKPKNMDYVEAATELSKQLEDVFGDYELPFGEKAYNYCYDNLCMTKDKNRVRWVIAHIPDVELRYIYMLEAMPELEY